MAYFITAEEKKVLEQEPYASYREFISNTESFSGGRKKEYHLFTDTERKRYGYVAGFRQGVNCEKGTLNYYIEGPNEQGVYFIRIVYSTLFESDDTASLVGGKFGALSKRFPFFYLQNTLARRAQITISDIQEDAYKCRGDISIEALINDKQYLEGVGYGILSYLIALLVIED